MATTPIQTIQRLTWISLIVGTVLRLLWPGDTFWFRDQIEFVQAVETYQQTGNWPWVGLSGSVGVRSPGASVWLFIALSYVTEDIYWQIVVLRLLTVVTLFAFYCFIQNQVPREERPVWCLGLILFSLNPLAVHYSRMYWETTFLFPLGFLAFLGHWYRHRFWGAGLWSICCVFAGQVYMAGFWYAAAFFLSTLCLDYRSNRLGRIHWGGLIFGAAVAALPLVMWIPELFNQFDQRGNSVVLENLFTPKVWSYLLFHSLGMYLHAAFAPNVWQFFRWPEIQAVPTYFVLALHIGMAVLGLLLLQSWVKHGIKGERSDPTQLSPYLWMVGAVGMTMQLTGLGVHSHYLIVVYPFLFFWVAKCLAAKLNLLLALAAINVLTSSCYLYYVHQHRGAPLGYYGETFSMFREKAANRSAP